MLRVVAGILNERTNKSSVEHQVHLPVWECVDAGLEQFVLFSKNKKRLLRKIYENSSFNSYNFRKNSGSVSL